MNMVISLFMLIFLIILIMMVLIFSLSKKSIMDMQKSTPFECGFNPMAYSRIPFSIHFFLVAVIFLIFDIEIIMIMPIIFTMKTSFVKYWTMTSIMFIIILIIGLLHEWKNGMINWIN